MHSVSVWMTCSIEIDAQAAIQGMTPFSQQIAEAAEREFSYGDRLVAVLEGVA